VSRTHKILRECTILSVAAIRQIRANVRISTDAELASGASRQLCPVNSAFDLLHAGKARFDGNALANNPARDFRPYF
jgi:hypothetical protein